MIQLQSLTSAGEGVVVEEKSWYLGVFIVGVGGGGGGMYHLYPPHLKGFDRGQASQLWCTQLQNFLRFMIL